MLVDCRASSAQMKLAAWMEQFRRAFTAPHWQHVLVLIAGAMFSSGRRTVVAALRDTLLIKEPRRPDGGRLRGSPPPNLNTTSQTRSHPSASRSLAPSLAPCRNASAASAEIAVSFYGTVKPSRFRLLDQRGGFAIRCRYRFGCVAWVANLRPKRARNSVSGWTSPQTAEAFSVREDTMRL